MQHTEFSEHRIIETMASTICQRKRRKSAHGIGGPLDLLRIEGWHSIHQSGMRLEASGSSFHYTSALEWKSRPFCIVLVLGDMNQNRHSTTLDLDRASQIYTSMHPSFPLHMRMVCEMVLERRSLYGWRRNIKRPIQLALENSYWVMRPVRLASKEKPPLEAQLDDAAMVVGDASSYESCVHW